MALLFMDGFDVGDYALKQWVAGTNDNGTFSVVAGRNAGSSVQTALASSGTGNRQAYVQKAFPAASQVVVGFALKVVSYGSSGSGAFAMNIHSDGGATAHLTLMSDPSTRLVQLRRGQPQGTVLATSTISLAAGDWNYLEMKATIADAGGTCEVRLNGATTPFMSYTGDTRNGGTSTAIDMLRIGSHRDTLATTGATCVYDDVYCLDSTGATNNDFIGDVRVVTLQPNAAGTDTQLTPTGSATNFQNVDEAPYSTADYNASATVGQRDTYNLSDLPTGTTVVYGIQSNIIAAKSDVTTANAKIPIRAGGNLYYGATNALSTSYQTYTDLYQVNPDTTAAWTPGDVNSLEAGMEVA